MKYFTSYPIFEVIYLLYLFIYIINVFKQFFRTVSGKNNLINNGRILIYLKKLSLHAIMSLQFMKILSTSSTVNTKLSSNGFSKTWIRNFFNLDLFYCKAFNIYNKRNKI